MIRVNARTNGLIFLHFGYWLMYLLLLSVVFAALTIHGKRTQNIFELFPLLTLSLAPNLLAFYAAYFFLFPRFLFRKNFYALIFFGILICLLSALAGSLLSAILFGFDQPVFKEPKEYIGLTLSFAFIAAIHATVALVIHGFIQWYDEIKLKAELTARNFEMESALIKSQINPHFLFNTLNNIDVLITRDAAQASLYLNKLSDILRYLVYDTKAAQISLETELAYIKKYLELQKIRTKNPNYVNFETLGEAKNLTVAPMIFFPFIENAFKHTENNKNSNTISIKVSIKQSEIIFDCVNTYQKSPPKSDYGGLGNELIEKRLTLLYPNKHSLEILDNEGVYKVNLVIEFLKN